MVAFFSLEHDALQRHPALVPRGLSFHTFPDSWLVSWRPMFLASCLLEPTIAKCFLCIL